MTTNEVIAHLIVDNIRLRQEIDSMHSSMRQLADGIRETLDAPAVLPPPRPLETVFIDGVVCDLLCDIAYFYFRKNGLLILLDVTVYCSA